MAARKWITSLSWPVVVSSIASFATLAIAVVGGFALWLESVDRRNDRITRAWTILATAAEFTEPTDRSGTRTTRRAKYGNVGQFAALRSLIDDDELLDGVYLSQFYLERANLSDGSFRHANIIASSLQNADLTNAVLTDTNFADTDLRGATLDGANLTRTNLQTSMGLTQAQIDRACYDGKHPPRLPSDLKPPQKIC